MYKRIFLMLAVPALLLLSACDRHDEHDGHRELETVVIESRDGNATELARWEHDGGWVVNNLPVLTPSDEGNFGRASWTVRMFDGAGNEIEMEGGRDADNNRICLTPYSARYAVTDPAVIYQPDGDGHVMVGGEERETFHCDHIHVYPRAAGTTTLRLDLYHVDHVDASTTLLPIEVAAP